MYNSGMQDTIYNPEESEKTKEEKIGNIISAIESIEYDGVSNSPADYSNDEMVVSILPKIPLLSQEIPGEIRTALIIGTGPLWNIPRILKDIDFVISVDINPMQVKRNRQRAEEILLANSINGLLPVPNLNIDENDITGKAVERHRLHAPQVEMDSYSSYHYLSSQQQLQHTKAFLQNSKIAYVCGDISNPVFTKKLGEILKSNDVNIVFAALTNVSEWVCGSKIDLSKRDSLINSLSLLPIANNCPIMHSRSSGRIGRSPIYAKLSTGLDSYGESLTQSNESLQIWLAKHFD
jgi:hypothetical protein